MEQILNKIHDLDWDSLVVEFVDNDITIKESFMNEHAFFNFIKNNLSKYEFHLVDHEIVNDIETNKTILKFIFEFDSSKKVLSTDYIKSLADDIMITLTDSEIKEVKDTEESIRDKFMKVLTIDTEGVEPKFYPFDVENSYLREDDDFYTNDHDEVLANAPTKEGDFITIVKVVK